ncbi:MAG: hypothetical protein ACYDCW_01585 [Acidithiobacillus ferrivorans]
MVMIIRFSTLFAVVVIAAKAGIFVADDASLFKNRALEPVEKRVARLIDEGVRRRAEVEEAADGVADMAQAIASSVVCAIVRVIRMVGRARNRAAIAAGGASVIASRSRAFRSMLALAGKPYRTELGGHYESA